MIYHVWIHYNSIAYPIHPDSGEIQLWIDGVSVITVNGLQLRESTEGKIKGMHFQTFFGGNLPNFSRLNIV